jgi:hypothetical protein
VSRVTVLKDELRRIVETKTGPITVIIRAEKPGKSGRVILRRKRGKKNIVELVIWDPTTPLQQTGLPLEERR